MKILDTNLWVYGTLQTNDQAVELLAAIDRGETTSAISAYMIQEALAAFDRTQSFSTADRDAVKTNFLTRLTRMTGLIEAPSSRDVSDALLRERRSGNQSGWFAGRQNTHVIPTSSGNMVTVDSKGRIVLPQEVRERLGIEPGTEVDIHEEDGKAVVEPEDDPEKVIERMEQLISEAATDRDPPDEEMHPIAEDHAETIRHQATSDTADE